ASYLAVVPAMAAALLAVLRATLGAGEGLVSVLNAVVAAVLFFPLVATLYDALGGPALPVAATAMALVTTTFAPLMVTAPGTRRALVSALLVTAIVFIGIANLVPTYTADAPRHLN